MNSDYNKKNSHKYIFPFLVQCTLYTAEEAAARPEEAVSCPAGSCSHADLTGPGQL